MRAPLKHGSTILFATPAKRAARKPPPPQPTWNGRTPQGGLRISPFKAGPKGLQRTGCITMTLRINAVNCGVEFEPVGL